VGFREKGQPEICAFDGATFQPIWCAPAVIEQSTREHVPLGVTGRTALYVDAAGVAHLHDLATGKERLAVKLKERAESVCAPAELPGKLWIQTREERGREIDPTTGAVADAPRPASCKKPLIEGICVQASELRPCAAVAAPPRSKEISLRAAVAEGANGVAAGDRRPGDGIPMILGYTAVPGGRGTIRWQRPVAPGDGLGARDAREDDLLLVAGRAIAHYQDRASAHHLVALDAATGKTLWDATSEQYNRVTATAARVYVWRWSRLDVRDAATGRLLGGVGYR
jgi:hypothetical protein